MNNSHGSPEALRQRTYRKMSGPEFFTDCSHNEAVNFAFVPSPIPSLRPPFLILIANDNNTTAVDLHVRIHSDTWEIDQHKIGEIALLAIFII